ncbi:MAG: heme o synthase [Fimbriimonadaceae bacterium]|nr:heme o synthase [Fimbriimonadaceae bacterium]
MTQTRWTNWTIAAILFTAFVILFGAFVRASLSGDGCGVSWPLCGGTLDGVNTSTKTVIELTHRVTSSMLGAFLLGFWLLLRKHEPKGSLLRKSVGWAFVGTMISALIGAVLVRYGWVTEDKSLMRMIAMPAHLLNNYFTLGALGVGYWASRGGRALKWRWSPASSMLFAIGVASLLFGLSGAISAMGSTAYSKEVDSAKGIAERLNLHLGESASPILKGGVAHPLLAVSLFALVIWAAGFISRNCPTEGVRRNARLLSIGYISQMVIGVVNLAISAPAWMQIVHLAAALIVWQIYVELGAHTLSEHEVSPAAEEPSEPDTRPLAEQVRAQVKAYIALTKPRVISLLIFTTTTAQIMAAKGWPHWSLVVWVGLGGYMMAGAANAINMILEKDLDLAMGRTASRPTVSNAISTPHAALFAASLAIGSFALLTFSANLLTAILAFAGLLFYVIVYTLILKRRTWQNIVIGGAAGAFPPLVGWASVTGDLGVLAWVLFAVVFLWTPVHFWALAILIKDDYAKAGVPMLPVVRGEHITALQISFYAVLTALVSLVPLVTNRLSYATIAIVVGLNLGLLVQSMGLLRTTTRPKAKALFKYSMVYLAVFFLVMAIDMTAR